MIMKRMGDGGTLYNVDTDAKKNEREDKHTPGPWKVYHENGSMGSGGHWGVETVEDEAFVARVSAGPSAHVNARLIAAAPELLDELKNALESLESYANSMDEWCGGMECPRCGNLAKRINAAKAIIAKAEGN
jgi:hypothetical protein